MVARLDAPLALVLSRAGLTAADLAAVEIIGGGMRPRCVKQRVAKALGLAGADDPAVGYGLRCARVCACECVRMRVLVCSIAGVFM